MSFEVLNRGLETTIQDYPGRIGYYNMGIPPSGPADNFASRIASLLVGEPLGNINQLGSALLETLAKGPTLKFLEETAVAITGADMAPTLNGEPILMWQSVRVKAGDILSFSSIKSTGCRTYIAIAGGIATPIFYGSRSTYKYGALGGYYGETLKKGQIIKTEKPKASLDELESRKLRPEIIPKYPKPSEEWNIKVVAGPQDDYYTEGALEMFTRGKTAWKVAPQSDRMGVRLTGPKLEYKPQDQRPPSQDRLAHPSNIPGCHGYAIGTVDICGDVPIIIGVDGVSLGGYCCIVTIVTAELWKVGQLKGNDLIRFYGISYEEAVNALKELEEKISEKKIIKT